MTDRARTEALTTAQLRGRATGTMVLAGFALGWANVGVSRYVPGAVHVVVVVLGAGITLSLLVGAARVLRSNPALDDGPAQGEAPGDRADEGAEQGVDINRRYGLIVAIEALAIAVLVVVLVAAGHPEMVAATVCLVVGVHFWPLARLFAEPLYHRTATALDAAAVAAFVLAPLTGHHLLWTALPGLGAAVTLYLTAALLLRGCAEPAPRPARPTPPSSG